MKKEGLQVCFKDTEILRGLKGSSILITGATGLIGQTLIKLLISINQESGLGIKIYAFIRNREKADEIFQKYDVDNGLTYVKGDLLREELHIAEPIDYIIHGASITNSRDFVEKPVETINTGLFGTEKILEFAKRKKVKAVAYLSSMEVYGSITEKRKLKEEDVGYLNPLSVRSSYSESKRMIENLCVSFFDEYAVPVKIIRLAQTFGPGVEYGDNRVFAEFARCVIEKKDIVLHTSGVSERMYLYSYDAAEAILTVLIKGKAGQAYNAANEATYCSVRQMADLVKRELSDGAMDVVIEENKEKAVKYSPEHYLYLDTEKLTKLGWTAKTDLITAYKKMIEAMKAGQ